MYNVCIYIYIYISLDCCHRLQLLMLLLRSGSLSLWPCAAPYPNTQQIPSRPALVRGNLCVQEFEAPGSGRNMKT